MSYAVLYQGMVAVQTGEWQDAERFLDEARTLSSSLDPFLDALILHEYGVMRLAQGQTQQARETLERETPW